VDLAALTTGWSFQFRFLNACGRLIDRRGRGFVRLHNLNAEIANLAQAQSGEMGNGVCHLPKNIFDRLEAVYSRAYVEVASAETLQKVAQYFPIVSGLARGTHCAIQSLQATIAIDHRAAFFREAE
jgi:hypothetical protein